MTFISIALQMKSMSKDLLCDMDRDKTDAAGIYTKTKISMENKVI
jgi:hypothetical protein